MYVAVKGGEKAISAAHAWLDETRRGDTSLPELSVAQIEQQMALAVDRVMAEGSCHDRFLAALAIKQAKGDLIEAAFLLRAYRTTLPRFGASLPLETSRMRLRRRISATYKDLPGGQVLGPTFDYTHRLLDFALAAEARDAAATPEAPGDAADVPRVTEILAREGLMQREATTSAEPGDLTREPLSFPAPRPVRLQNLARGDEGFLLALGVEITPPELGFAIDIGDIGITECQMVNQFAGSRTEPAQFTRGYGLVFGHGERRAMSMALVDRGLRARELGEEADAPAQQEEFVLYHSDNIEATGFVEHLKLPHYVDFQSELENLRTIRRAAEAELREAAE
jgi:alpha-D-ribose 1-methylphosphonate 5-triphosphate synthase subunit PhnI